MSSGERLARWAADLQWEALGPELQDKVRSHVLDTLGVMYAGLATPHGLAAQRVVRAWGGAAESTVVGLGWRLPAPHAAFLNALHARARTFDDTYETGPLHPGSAVVGAALACAEAARVPGSRFLAAVAAGYEVATRVSAAVSPSHYGMGFHNTGTCNAFGAAAAAGRALGLGPDAVTAALGLAGEGAAGLRQYQVDGSMADSSLAGARAAQTGVIAAQLAAAGLGGPRAILDGPWGFCRVMAAEADTGRLDRRLGEVYEFVATALKPFPTCRFTHGPIEVLLELRRRHGIRPDQVREVCIAAFRQSVEVSDRPEVRSGFDAILSHQWAAALALGAGRVDLEGLSDASLADPGLRRLAGRVRVVHAEALDRRYPAKWPHRVTVALEGGRSLEAESDDPPGGAARPLAPEQVAAKFRSLAGPVLGRRRAEQVIEAVRMLDAEHDLRALVPLLHPPQTGGA